MKTKIKICGLTTEREASYLNEIQADYAGFVFFEKSKRNVTIAQAKRVKEKLQEQIKTVAVTVSPELSLIRQIEEAGFSLIQIHGEIQKEVLKEIRIPIWMAVNVSDLESAAQLLKKLEPMENRICGYVIDAAAYGSGQTFLWESFTGNPGAEALLEKVRKKTFILAGGLGADNVKEAIRIFSPDVVDVSSGVEGCDGKDRTKIKEFAERVRKHG